MSDHTGGTGPAGASRFDGPWVSLPADVSSSRQRPVGADVCVRGAEICRRSWLLEVVSEAFGGALHGLLLPLVDLTCAGVSFLPVLKAVWYLRLEKPELEICPSCVPLALPFTARNSKT